VESSFQQFIAMQTHVGSTNRQIISLNAKILKFLTAFIFRQFLKIFGIRDVISYYTVMALSFMCT